MNKEIEAKLKEFFKEEELEWKPQSLGFNGDKPWLMALCYIQARAIQDRLDDVMGIGNWKDTYRITPHGVICNLALWDSEKKEWVDKENGAEETAIESFKGGISGAFKRVASSGWGIGRYLYELETNFAECTLTKTKDYTYAKDKKTSKVMYWKTPAMDKKYLPKGETPNQEPILTPHGEDTTQTYLDDAERKLNAITTLEDLETLKQEFKADKGIVKYFQKRKESQAILSLKIMINTTEERLGE